MRKTNRSLLKDGNSIRMLIENIKDINKYPLEKFYGTLMTYELDHIKTREKTRKSKEEETKESPKCQIALKSSIVEGT